VNAVITAAMSWKFNLNLFILFCFKLLLIYSTCILSIHSRYYSAKMPKARDYMARKNVKAGAANEENKGPANKKKAFWF